MREPSFSEIRENNPNATFRAVPYGSLPRNHVGFNRSSDGVPYVVNTLSPSKRYGIAELKVFIDYEPLKALKAVRS